MPNTCTITGNVKNLLGSNVQNCTVKVSTLTPFFHGSAWISGEVTSTTTDSSGNFSVAVIETETVGKKLTFTFEYYDGVAATRQKTYTVIVPDEATSTLADLVTADSLPATITTLPAANITVTAISNLAADDVQDALAELQADIDTRALDSDFDAHIADSTAAHAASAISNSASGNLASTDVQSALNELQTDIDTRALASDLTAHTGDTADAHDASAISSVAAGNLAATNVQDALDELQTDIDTRATSAALTTEASTRASADTTLQTNIDNHLNDTADAHDASAISSVAAGNLAATNVQDALDELQTDVDTRATSSALTTHEADTTTHGTTGAIVGTSDSQTLTNKTIDADSNTLSNIANAQIKAAAAIAYSKLNLTGTIVNADVNASAAIAVSKLAAGSSGQVIKMVGATPTWSTFSGGINYAGSDSDAEGGVGNWGVYDDAATDPVDGTGGTSTLAITQSSSSPLRGSYSYLITPNSGAAGEGAALAFTIDAADKAKPISISFDYELSGTVSEGDYRVWIYDVTNGALIQPAPYKIPSGITGTQYKFQASFQTASNSTSYRLLIHQAAATSVTLKFDNVFVGPEQRVLAPPVTDWQTFTPTGSWVANTTYTGRWRRVGDSMEVQASLALSGAPTSATLTVNLPSGYTVDTSKILQTEDSYLLGDGSILDAATAGYRTGVFYNNTTSVIVQVLKEGTGTHTSFLGVTQAVPITFGNGDKVNLTYRVPITGWSSSVEMSSSADTRVVAAKYSGSTTSVSNGAAATLLFPTLHRDSHNSFDTATGIYTIPVAGWYRLSASTRLGSVAASVSGQYALFFSRNGTAEEFGNDNRYAESTTAMPRGNVATTTYYFNAGDTVRVRYFNNIGAAITMNFGEFSIERVSGPSQIAASESVVAVYQMNGSNGNTSIANGGVEVMDFNVKVKDTHNAVTTGASWKFYAPVAGDYRVSANTAWATTANLTDAILVVTRDGSEFAWLGRGLQLSLSGSAIVPMTAGQYIEVKMYQTDSAAAAHSFDTTSAIRNTVSIEKVGH